MTKDVAIKIKELTYEIMAYFNSLYKTDPIKGKVLAKLIEDGSLSEQLENAITIHTKEAIDYIDFSTIHKIASGQKSFKDGSMAQHAGFIISDIEQSKIKK
jgi:acyl-CoA thioesterase